MQIFSISCSVYIRLHIGITYLYSLKEVDDGLRGTGQNILRSGR